MTLPAIALGVSMVVGFGASWIAGRRTGRNALFWAMEHDTQFRRQLLEKLAGLEGARIVGRE